MCTTCGCGQDENGVRILDLNDKNTHSHEHSHGDGHTHSHPHSHEHHHHHDHSHDHSHEHDHSHVHDSRIIELEKDILHQNDLLAAQNRGFFDAKGIIAINLVSSPGSGKTTFLERTLSDLGNDFKFHVIEGDQQTLNDAKRIDALGIPVVQVNTGKGCHLDGEMVYKAVKKLQPESDSILMIENVGNLVCPSMFDLGENFRVVIISTTEGDDKPAKYPDMFHGSDICIINKIDLLPYLNFDVEQAKEHARKLNPSLKFFEVSATTGDGMESWYEYLKTYKP